MRGHSSHLPPLKCERLHPARLPAKPQMPSVYATELLWFQTQDIHSTTVLDPQTDMLPLVAEVLSMTTSMPSANMGNSLRQAQSQL